MSTVRLRRLNADHEKLLELVRLHPRLELIQADGCPPERYQLKYRLKGLRLKQDDLVIAKEHLVEVALPLGYPRTPPVCRMLTPVFHPNISPHAICIGDHWSAGEPLASIVIRIGEMIAFQTYNTKSPLNGEAARWTDENIDRLPLDPVSLLPDESRMRSVASKSPPPSPAPTKSATNESTVPREEVSAAEPPVQFTCPGCKVTLRIPRSKAGANVRCPKCHAITRLPEGI